MELDQIPYITGELMGAVEKAYPRRSAVPQVQTSNELWFREGQHSVVAWLRRIKEQQDTKKG